MIYFESLDPNETQSALLSARLNIFYAKRLLQQGVLTTGMFALYDSLLFAMYHYEVKHEDSVTIDLCDGTGLFHRLVVAGLFEDPYAFDRLSLKIEQAIWQKSVLPDVNAVMDEAEVILTKLGILPFQESTLPKELWMAVSRESELHTY